MYQDVQLNSRLNLFLVIISQNYGTDNYALKIKSNKQPCLNVKCMGLNSIYRFIHAIGIYYIYSAAAVAKLISLILVN